MTISQEILQRVAQGLGAERITNTHIIQALWGGYGELFRAELIGSEYKSVIVKHIKLPQPSEHPRGWVSDVSHERKLRS